MGGGEWGGIRTGQMRGAAVGLSHYCGFALHCFVWAFMLCIHSKTSWWRAGCWLLRNSWSSWGVFFLDFFFSFSHAVWCLTSDPQSEHYTMLENKMILLRHSSSNQKIQMHLSKLVWHCSKLETLRLWCWGSNYLCMCTPPLDSN